jgi:diguanylate cyclase (GGDEF)-like protein/PAS domain S-box-containing protein
MSASAALVPGAASSLNFEPAATPPFSVRITGVAMPDSLTSSEHTRIKALESLGVLDTPAEQRFDRFTRLAAMTFGVPIALVSLVDQNRQWFKSRCGLDVAETPRSMAFCSHAVALGDMLVIEDAAADPLFAANPLVTGAPHIRFYAGQPLFCDGQAVGTLCIIDRAPRSLDQAQRQCLRDLAALAEAELNHPRVATARLMAEQALKALNAELEARIAERTVELERRLGELSQEIAHRKEVEVSLQHSETWNRTIVSASYSGFVGADAEGCIVEWNASAERIFGWPRAQALGRSLSELIVPPDMRTAHESGMRRYLETGKGSVMNRKVEVPALTASGRRITVEMTISTYEWKGKRCFGAFMNDISERIRTQQQLEEKQELLDAVLESIDVVVAACDAVGNLTLFNRAARAMYGHDLKNVVPAEWSRHYALYHVDGRTQLAMDEVPLVRALKGESVRDQALVIAPEGGAPHTMLASGRPLRGASGRPLGAVVTMKDITELNASREQLELNERRLRAITDNVPVLISHLDSGRRYVFANVVHQSWLGKAPEQILGKTMEEAFGADYPAPQAEALEQAWNGQASQCEHEIVRKKHTRIVHTTFLPQLRDGAVVGVYALTTDATTSRLHERSLHALAHTDTLTGLPNRRHFESALREAANRVSRQGRGTALLYLDIDHFKQINDRHGHAVGDAVLVEFARRLGASVRSSDLVARLAGDEFTVLLHDVGGEADLELVARKILAAMQAPFALGACTLQVGTSIGAALAGEAGPAPAMLTEAADRALYAAKEAGRNTFAMLRVGRERAHSPAEPAALAHG